MMTIDRALRLARKWAGGSVCTLKEGEAQEYHQLCAEALERSRWIPVTERLPEDDLPADSVRQQLKVLVAIKKENGSYVIRTQTRVRQKFYAAKRFGNWYWGKHAYGDVTHWMPLPNKPKEE